MRAVAPSAGLEENPWDTKMFRDGFELLTKIWKTGRIPLEARPSLSVQETLDDLALVLKGTSVFA